VNTHMRTTSSATGLLFSKIPSIGACQAQPDAVCSDVELWSTKTLLGPT
jgi:hypothetical protein